MTPDSDDAATPPATDAAHTAGAAPTLWEGDLGTLGEQSRRALLELLQGPYLSGRRRPQLWQALIADEAAIRSRLHDLFLDVVIDQPNGLSDIRVLAALADGLGVDLGFRTPAQARAELAELGPWEGERGQAPEYSPGLAVEPGTPADGSTPVVLATWRMLLDEGRLEDGEPYLARTAREPLARLSLTTATALGAAEGDLVTVSTDRGSVTLPLAVTEMCDGVVWLPGNSTGSHLRRSLVAGPGDLVQVRTGAAA